MAGHSHWAGIKHKKALIDSKRGKAWSKCSKALIVAAKMSGGDPDTNSRLRLAISDAKSVNMPNDTINRAIKKGTGELDGGNVEEVLYEGYGPNGVAIMCDILTDNRNRTAPEIRKLFEVHGGKLGATNCAAQMKISGPIRPLPRQLQFLGEREPAASEDYVRAVLLPLAERAYRRPLTNAEQTARGKITTAASGWRWTR